MFKIAEGTKKVLSITLTVSALAVLFAFFYYRNINASQDPRILKAIKHLAQYEKESAGLDISASFPLLDSAFRVFNSLPDYTDSFEKGVIYNNKCSNLLLTAMYDSVPGVIEKSSLLDLAGRYCDSSIMVYQRWLSDWEQLPEEEILMRIKPFMKEDDPAFSEYNFKKILNRRVKYISEAQIETPRRLSVSLTNKGTIFRHRMMPDSAAVYYDRALRLWKHNRTAISNISVLMGGDPVKPTVIESLFPPNKKMQN